MELVTGMLKSGSLYPAVLSAGLDHDAVDVRKGASRWRARLPQLL